MPIESCQAAPSATMFAELWQHSALRRWLQAMAIRISNFTLRTHVWFGNDADFTAQREKLLGLRYQIYVAELGKPLPNADHQRKQLPVAHDDCAWHLLVCNWRGAPIGCVRFHLGVHLPDALLAPMQLQDLPEQERLRTGYVSKLMVARTKRGRGAALLLMHEMAALAMRQTDATGDCALFHCNPKLVHGYEKLGFRVIGRPFVDAHVGLQVPMVYLLGDLTYLRQIRSPLIDVARMVKSSTDRIQWLHQRYLKARNTLADHHCHTQIEGPQS